MRFGILGEAVAWDADGSELALRPKSRALLALLALDPGRVVPAHKIVAGLYGDAPPTRAGNAVQAQVSRLRQRLGAGTVEFHRDGYRLVAAPRDVDAQRFEELVARGRKALAVTDAASAATTLREALRLWRGPALLDLDDPALVGDRLARLDELWLAAAEDLATAEIALGAADETVPGLRELVAAHPLREGLWASLVRALAESGRRAEALAVFEEARSLLADELGTDPSPELRDLHQSLLRDDGPAPLPRPRRPPAQLTSLVGREDALDRLTDRIRTERLVTLTGIGGVGKSRLAIEAAAALEGEVDVCFVELAPVTEPDDVPTAVGSALGLRPQGSPAVVDQLVNALARRPVVLLLDNCERLSAPVAALVHTLLGACPRLRVVATSRQSLGITGESVWPVSPLDDAAVRLFEDRAVQADPGFTLDDSREDVLRICRALDGIPLGIELAAARVRAVPLADMAAHLEDSLSLLTRDAPAGDPRHRSLRAAVDWSWDLLDNAERSLARRLSVFSRGATVESARSVCDLPDTARLLAGLVDKSLVELREGRYRMLETIRTFAREGLADEDLWRRRHAEHHLRLAQEADPHLRGRDQLRWLERLDQEYADLRAALRWATGADVRLALQLASGLATYWWLRGRRHDAAVLCRSLLDEVGNEPPDDLAEEYLLAVFTAATEATGPDPLGEHLDTVNRIVGDWSGPPRQPMATIMWARQSGPAPTRSGPLTPPPEDVLDSDPWSRALHALSDGLQELYGGRAVAAEQSLLTALTRFRAIGERWGTMKALAEGARFQARRGQHRRAIEMLDESVELASRLRAPEDLAEWLRRRARVRVAAGEPDAALSDARRAVDVAGDTGAPEAAALAHSALADVARLGGDPEAARSAAEHALGLCPLGWARPSEARTETLVVLGRIATAEGRLGEATACLLEAASADDPLAAATAVEGLAAVAVADRDGEPAARLLGLASVLRGGSLVADPDVDRVSAAARELLGPEAFETALDAAREVPRDEALALALQGWSADGQ